MYDYCNAMTGEVSGGEEPGSQDWNLNMYSTCLLITVMLLISTVHLILLLSFANLTYMNAMASVSCMNV